MRVIILLLFCLLSARQTSGQKVIEQYKSQNKNLRIGFGKSDLIPYNENGYTLVLPGSSSNIIGVLVSFEDRKFDLQTDSTQQIYQKAARENFAVLYVSTGVPADLFFSTKSLEYVDSLMRDVFRSNHIPNKNIFFLGVNLSGHRALKYIIYCKQGKSKFNPDTKGIVLCDGVLDWVRQWYESKKAIRDNFAESSVSEAKLTTYLLEKNLETTPKNGIQKYLEFSAYSYFDEKSRQLKYFQQCSVRAYTEPATYYWTEAKRKTVFDTNFPDMVGVINELKLAGNKKSQLIVFNQDKKNMDRRNPNYTWGLVDKTELMNWITSQTK
jgi:hypothetical protein